MALLAPLARLPGETHRRRECLIAPQRGGPRTEPQVLARPQPRSYRSCVLNVGNIAIALAFAASVTEP